MSAATDLLAYALFVLLAWYLPGVAAVRVLPASVPGPVRLAVCWSGAPIVFSVLAVLLGPLGADPVWIVVGLASIALAVVVAGRAWRGWLELVQAHRGIFALPLAFLVLGALLPADTSVTADTNAHIAAIHRSVEERAVFPERGFHGDAASRGVDPRFGTLHALHGAAARLTGLEARDAWNASRGIGLAILVSGALALLTTLVASRIAIAVGVVGVVALHGGIYYNVLSVSAYPLWLSLGAIWTVLAMFLSAASVHPRACALIGGLTLAGLAGIHFFAFMLAGFLAGAWAVVAPRAQRARALGTTAIAAVVSVPWVGLRLATSYVNDNPIHQKVWQCMEWAPGLYSASPVFVAGWLFPFGVVALVWALARWRTLAGVHSWRWLVASAALALVWIGVPWLLTPSMELIGFLPLRLLMAVGTGFLLALLVDRSGRRRMLVGSVAILLMAPSLVQRVDAVRAHDALVDPAEWSGLVRHLGGQAAGRPVVLSDPFTMLALSADAAVDVVAVPDGRSSPRDAQAIDRLRDAWRAMSPAIAGPATSEVLERRAVTHVVVNRALPPGLSSYEYPVDAAGDGRQLLKFALNPGRFREVWAGPRLSLFEVVPDAAAAWDESWLGDCASMRPDSVGATAIGDGYAVVDPAATVLDGPGGRALRLEGALVWDGSGVAPDRQLVVRLDRLPGSGHWFGKPVRKFKEALGAPPARYRWATAPGMGRCPTWRAGEVASVDLALSFGLPGGIAPGEYLVTLAARDRSVFEPVQPRDLLVDDDSWRGATVSRVTIR